MTKLTAEQNELLDLRDRVFDLEEENRALKKQIAGDACFPLEWRLQPAEARLLSALMAAPAGYRPRDMLLKIVSPAKDDLKIVDTRVCTLRRKLKPLGIAIQTRFGEGYELPIASRQKITRAIEARR